MKNLKKVLIFTIAFFIILTLCSIVKAKTSYNMVAEPEEITLGETSVITVTVTGGDWNVEFSGDIDQKPWVSSNGDKTENVTENKPINFTPDEVGTYTITISGTVSDYDTKKPDPINKTVTIVVKEKPQEQKPTEEDQDQPTNPEPQEPTNPEPEQNTEPKVTITDMNAVKYTTDNLNVRESYTPSSERIGYLNKGDSVTIIGRCSNGWYKVKLPNGTEGFVSGEYLTDEKPTVTKSSTATLANLTVTPGSLNETFARDKYNYTMTVESDVETIDIDAVPTDSNAKVTVTGNTGLKAGTGNEIKIKVLAEDEISTKTYTIKVTKLATEEENPNIIDEPVEAVLGLSSLTIDGLNLTPSFKSDIYEYKATLTDKTIEKLKVNAKATFEDAKVEILGADQIKDGENVITIIVTSASGEETITYQVLVSKTDDITAVANTTVAKNNNQGIVIALIILIIVLAIILVFILIKKKQNEKPMKIYEDGDYNETDDEEYNSSTETKEENNEQNEEEKTEEYDYEDDDDDDDWGAPKRKFFDKFRRNGRHF